MIARHLAALPRADRRGLVKTEVRSISNEIADWWHYSIQPSIDADLERPDVGWVWPAIIAWNNDLLPQRPQGLAICARQGGEGGTLGVDLFPLAMLQLVTRYPFADDSGSLSVLLHRMSTVPKDYRVPGAPRLVGQAGVDVALVKAYLHGYAGRSMLVVGRKAQAALSEWYTGTCGMMEYQPTARPNRCFLHQPRTAHQAYRRLGIYREQQA